MFGIFHYHLVVCTYLCTARSTEERTRQSPRPGNDCIARACQANFTITILQLQFYNFTITILQV
jgi:hypothetical protein